MFVLFLGVVDNTCIPLHPMTDETLTAKVSKKVSSGDSKYFELKTFSYKPRSHTAADHDFSEAKRIVHDTKQSLKVAEALDEEFGRTHMPESIAVLLREPEVSAKDSVEHIRPCVEGGSGNRRDTG